MPDPVAVHTETFNLHLELEWAGGTIAEFETNFREFDWNVPKFVYFAEPMSGFGAHLALNAFETTIRDHSGPLVHVLAGGILDLHDNGHVDIGASAAADVRILRISEASVFLGVQGTVTADPAGGSASVTFAPTFSIQFGASAHP